MVAEEALNKMLNVTGGETKVKAVESVKYYILGNWSEIMEFVKTKDKSLQCSKEEHVIHIHSDRMDSRLLGWNRTKHGELDDMPIYSISYM